MKKIVFGCVILILMVGCKQLNGVKDKNGAEVLIGVKVERVKLANQIVKLSYSGTVQAFQTIPLSFEGMGTVQKVLVQEGDRVERGQLLATLDATDIESSHQAAQAMYTQAKDTYQRMKQVYEKGSLPQIKWVEIKSNLEQAKVQLNLSKSRVDKCNLFAPQSGTIGVRNIEPGQSSATGTAPFILIKIEKVLINFSVPENEIAKIEKGKRAVVRVSALGNKSFEGVISHVGVMANAYARTYMAKITVQNSHEVIKPGMVCDVTIDNIAVNETDQKLLIVPYRAVTTDHNGDAFVYTVQAHKKRVTKQIVKIGTYNKDGLVVLSGLSVDQMIVVEGKEKLANNTKINIQ